MGIMKRHGHWHYEFVADGRRYRRSTGLDATAPNKTAAFRLELEHRQAIAEGRAFRPRIKVRQFSDAADDYLSAMDAAHRARPNTAQRLRVSFASLKAHFGLQPVTSITAGDVDSYKTWRLNDAKVRDVTLRHDLHALSNFYRWAIRNAYAVRNPVRDVRIPSDKDALRIHVLSRDEERAYFAAAEHDQMLFDFARILLSQGMRPDELLSLSVEDVDLLGGKIHIRRAKTSAGRRTLMMTGETRSILARRVAEGGVLWPGKRLAKGSRASYSGMIKKHLRALKASGTSFVLYDLRHTFATRMAEAGCPLVTLASLLGHSGLRVVARYVHPSAEHQAEAMRRYEASQVAQQEPTTGVKQ